ncbi:putative secreted protein [Streptomyces sp. B4I13]|uniref:protease inhibitor I42 family protein n=1 Tax=Streptomyces sp. B4I13 TaxID=3042271 RepID=UPI002783E72D|nr:protease inhibitor I42 family protein [Streptomyces sp. B4I13]MDQ0960891.1 putative secreted protein [Streptomyces sp. B4I13]
MVEHLADRTSAEGPFEVERGDTVRLVLDENPTTGFRWSVAAIDGVPVEVVGSDFAPGPTTRPGAGGRREFLLHTPQPGTAEVRLELRRTWSGERADALCFTLRIT